MRLAERHPSLPYVAPFAVFMLLLAVGPKLPIPQPWESVLRVSILIATLAVFSRDAISWRAPHWLGSILVGVGVFLVWIAPDMLIPGWRAHWLFTNSITGEAKSSMPADALGDTLTVALRITRAAILVPIIEELFWRGWLPRWIQNNDFRKVPLGRYTTAAFWITAVLFASEHGPYWEVGLLAGIAYNLWLMRTKSLGDVILAHAVTNACLAGFVMVTHRWEYWM
jgi:hypothetical protein